jgi:DNA replication licensing factor MCM5
VGYGLRKITAPGICDNRAANGEKNNCPPNPYKFDADASEFFDQQMMTMQEAPELIPTGEMPRSLLLTCDRSLTDKCTPGNRVKVVGVLTITKKQTDN